MSATLYAYGSAIVVTLVGSMIEHHFPTYGSLIAFSTGYIVGRLIEGAR